MRKFTVTLVILVMSACVSQTSGWVYTKDDKLNPSREQHLFEEHHDFCQKKLNLARDSKKEYGLQTDPQGAYDHCMQIKGWQPVILNDE